MKKLYTTLAAMLVAVLALNAQVTVTFQVDVSSHSDSVTIDPAGMHIAGNLGDGGAEINGTAWVNWSPGDGAMTDLGNGLWSIDVTLTSATAGDTLLYKFVNGPNWGSNEGAAALADCGVDDGNGGYNRVLVVPATDETISVCYDYCVGCDAVGQNELVSTELSIYPNPASSVVTVDFGSLSTTSNVELINALGQVVFVDQVAANTNQININVDALPSGLYFVTVRNENETTVEKIQIK